MGGGGGQKLRKYLKKKSKLSYKLKLFVSSCFEKSYLRDTIVEKRIKTVVSLMRESRRGSKRV